MSAQLLDLASSASALRLPRPKVGPVAAMQVGDREWNRQGQMVLGPDQPSAKIHLADVAGSLSHALDLTEGQPMGHAVRTTRIGMRLGGLLGLSEKQLGALFYALLLKDLGCSSNASRMASLFGTDDRSLKYAFKLTDWTRTSDSARYAFKNAMPSMSAMRRAWNTLMMGVKHKGAGREMIAARCEQGANIASLLSLPKGTAEAIGSLDEHWDGSGMPNGTQGSGIPMLSRIAGIAQTVEVFVSAFDVEAAYEMVRQRRGTWFDPVLVDCLSTFKRDTQFWASLRGADSLQSLADLEPRDRVIVADERKLDAVAEGFARVIDAKSPFTGRHSHNVAFLSVKIGRGLGMSRVELVQLRRAALLHDIGKLGVSNRILDKPSALDDSEFAEMRKHTRYTLEILNRVPSFKKFALTAASHHERLDGTGYHLGLTSLDLGRDARILAVADICEALSAERPYRDAMPIDTVLSRLDELVAAGHLCPQANDALADWFEGGGQLQIASKPGESDAQAA